MINCLSIIIPCHNEEKTIAEVVDKVYKLELGVVRTEVIVVNDGSTDTSADKLVECQRQYPSLVLITLPIRSGKGTAVRSGLAVARGDWVVVQDADEEYDPADLARLLDYVQSNNVLCVFGSRNLGNTARGHWLFYWGGIGVTKLANMLYQQKLTDAATCYKLVRRDVINTLNLQCVSFEFCYELIAKISRLGLTIPEISITYRPRSKRDGKKIRFRDGVLALLTLLRYYWWNPLK